MGKVHQIVIPYIMMDKKAPAQHKNYRNDALWETTKSFLMGDNKAPVA